MRFLLSCRLSFSLLVAMATPLFWMIACSAPTPGTPGTGGAGGAQNPDPSPACPASVEDPCMRYHIPLVGNPSFDVPLRNKYIAAFGNACYMSEVGTFDCFYKKWETACDDAVKIGEVSGNAPYDKSYTCQPVVGTDDYTLQVGPDVANKLTVNYQAAPRQTPLTEIDGTPTEVSGPYRDLPELKGVEPGKDFYDETDMVNDAGEPLKQRNWILQVNRNANDGGVHSDLAGFMWPCKEQDGGLTTCTEPKVLEDPDTKTFFDPGAIAEVHHVVPKSDKRCCPWGTNSNKNAAVISRKLNNFFTNNNPPADEVKQLNAAQPYTP